MANLTFKQSFVHLPSLQPAFDLAARCETADGFATKIYWHALKDRQNDNNALDYLCFADGELIAMLNILFFSESVELTPLVDPKFRRQGVAKKMFNIAFAKLRNYIVNHYTLICHIKAQSLLERCKQHGGVHDHDEIEMFAPQTITAKADKKVILERAQESDISVLAKIHEQSFEKPSAEQMELRFSVTLKENHRRVYLAKTENDEVVGKLHVRIDHHRVYLHDVGIVPERRNQGYGKALMLEWLKRFASEYTLPIAVEVLGYNKAALKLYENCGFYIVNQYQFWKFPLT